METITDTKPHRKVFISYAWGTEDYSQKVQKLVNSLRGAGIDTVYDKFDLAEGADIHAFMEQAVTSKDIDKVLILCDKQYQEKADQRKGGVGKETLIISPEVYNDANLIGRNKKFIPVIMELDENGHAYLPAYLKSKVYIDYTHEDGTALERLIRVIYDCPELVAPPLGQAPVYITNPNNNISFPSYYKLDKAIESLYEDKRNITLLISTAFSSVVEDLGKVKIEYNNDANVIADNVMQQIEVLRPMRNKLIELFHTIITASYTELVSKEIRSFFEKACNLAEAPITFNGRVNDMQKDPIKFFIYETYLYFIAILLQNENFELIQRFLSGYYITRENGSSELISPALLYDTLKTFFYINSRDERNLLSMQANLVCQYAGVCGITKDKLAQADFILYLANKTPYGRTPWLIIYADPYRPLEIFGRATSKQYLDKILKIFNFSSKEELVKLEQNREDSIERREFGWKSAKTLMNIDNLATKV